MLSDGHVTYTPGLSENRGGTSSYTASDVLGNLWFVDDASAAQTYYQDTSAFGSGVGMGIGGTEASPFKFGGANGCQTDSDIGLVLMGHRYYDTRIGRFITQDHAKDGGNWYAYCGNNPVNKTDPSGLSTGLPGTLGAPDQHYGGFVGSDPFKLFGLSDGQSNTSNFQMGTGQGAAQQTQGPAIPGTDLISISQGMEHPAPIVVDDGIVSVSYGISVSGGLVRWSGGFGIAYDFATGKLEVFRVSGVYAGLGFGASIGTGFTIGNDTLGNFGGFNGPSSNFDVISGSHGFGGLEWNPNYKGIEFSPPGWGPFEYTNRGEEDGVYYGNSNTTPVTKPFSFSLPTVPTLHF